MKNKIVLNLIATNKYLSFLDIIVPSIESYFFPNSDITILVHTNLDLPGNLGSYPKIKFVKNSIDHEPWPFTTLKRFHYFLSSREEIEKSDYSFYVDVDSKFIKEISEDLLPTEGMAGTIHPCLFNGPGTPDRNPNSTAYIPVGSNNRYFCGGFFGGTSREFLEMSEEIAKNIDSDLEKGVMAVWHDESHLNKHFFSSPPEVVFDHPFAIAENLTQEKPESKILFLDKNALGGHDFFRS